MLELIAICLVIWVCVRLLTTGLSVAPAPDPAPEADQIFKTLRPHHKKAIKDEGLVIADFTCTNCQFVTTCRSAYDLYNTNGDCLEEK